MVKWLSCDHFTKYTLENLNVQNLGWDVDLKNFDNLVNALQEAVDLDFASYVARPVTIILEM